MNTFNSIHKKNAYILDFGRVLADFDIDIALQKLCDFSLLKTNYQSLNDLLFRQHRNLFIDHELGVLAPERFYIEISNIFGLKLSYEQFTEIWAEIFTENTKIIDFLEKISGSPKIILSNIDPIHWEFVKSFSVVKNYFSDKECITSFDVGLRKPDKKIYELALSRLPRSANVYYIDDMEENIAAGNAVGLTAIQYDCRFDNAESLMQYI
jgi:HAD superfamily hydrolase (TIGR01549 family)